MEIDLSGATDFEPYSAHTEGLAEYGIAEGLVKLQPNGISAKVESLSDHATWHVVAYLDKERIGGVSCTCPNGTRGGVRARCWHACALEQLVQARLDGRA